jgi:hypothetical protein
MFRFIQWFGRRPARQNPAPARVGPSSGTGVDEFSSLSIALLKASKSTAERSNAQRQMVQDIAKMEEQIQASARRSATNSQQTAENTESVARATEHGHTLMETTSAAMHQMSQTAQESAALMREFVLRMSEVSRVVETVSDIARQTNLLALNAAVEAAHAGKQGDGFNVIAQEIRSLADRAGQSTTEIADSIGRMAASAHAAEKAMRVGEEAAGVSIRRNLEVQQSLRSIRDSMQQVQSMSAEVASASNRQIAAVERLSQHLGQIDSMASESTFEADAAAEMSIRLVLSAAQLGNRSGRSRSAHRLAGRDAEAEKLQRRIDQHAPVVARAMDLLRSDCQTAGTPQLSGESDIGARKIRGLRFGATAAVDATALVDRVNQQTGCVATIFVRDGDDFVRAATNVKRSDGQRATGTILNPKGAAIDRLKRATPYEGAVYVLGKSFFAAYEPIVLASGEVAGALYVGLSLEQ